MVLDHLRNIFGKWNWNRFKIDTKESERKCATKSFFCIVLGNSIFLSEKIKRKKYHFEFNFLNLLFQVWVCQSATSKGAGAWSSDRSHSRLGGRRKGMPIFIAAAQKARLFYQREKKNLICWTVKLFETAVVKMVVEIQISQLGEILHMGSVAVGSDHKDRYFALFPSTLLILSVSSRMSAFIYEVSSLLKNIQKFYGSLLHPGVNPTKRSFFRVSDFRC